MSIGNTFKEFCQSIKLVDSDVRNDTFKKITKKINEKAKKCKTNEKEKIEAIGGTTEVI